ncbi:MAG: nucleoside/nucleotide kinase family protein [Ilumatobacteraceae bacterium]
MIAEASTAAIELAEALVARGGRLLGITGPPGAGKSTLAAVLVAHFGDRARLLPMDGFHLADDELARRGSLQRKGAPDTFDAAGFVVALARVRARHDDVLVPRFDRDIEAAIAGSIRIEPDVDLVVTEGNYLLLDEPPWSQVVAHLDETWMLRLGDSERVERLVARHIAHGRSPEAARRWVADVDEPNATLVARRSLPPDVWLDVTP